MHDILYCPAVYWNFCMDKKRSSSSDHMAYT